MHHAEHQQPSSSNALQTLQLLTPLSPPRKRHPRCQGCTRSIPIYGFTKITPVYCRTQGDTLNIVRAYQPLWFFSTTMQQHKSQALFCPGRFLSLNPECIFCQRDSMQHLPTNGCLTKCFGNVSQRVQKCMSLQQVGQWAKPAERTQQKGA